MCITTWFEKETVQVKRELVDKCKYKWKTMENYEAETGNVLGNK